MLGGIDKFIRSNRRGNVAWNYSSGNLGNGTKIQLELVCSAVRCCAFVCDKALVYAAFRLALESKLHQYRVMSGEKRVRICQNPFIICTSQRANSSL